MEKKYIATSSKAKAITISYLSGEDFLQFKDKRDDTKTIYSFKNSEKIQMIIKFISAFKE